MKVRTQKELLEVMLTNIGSLRSGLCFLSSELFTQGIITFDEHIVMRNYIKYHKPSIFSSWNAFWNAGSGFYWSRGDVEPRVKWLKQHIKKLS
jgi:hypothetical protein